MVWVAAVLLIVVNTVWLFTVAIGIPGTWLMILTTAGVAWYYRDAPLMSVWVIGAAVALAVIGEALEFVLSAAGAKKAGGTRWGAVGSILGAIVGGILGTLFIPIPLLGSLIGACAGAFVGALGTEVARGGEFGFAFRSGKGAAVGRFWGTVAKLAVGAAIWLVIAVAALVP